MSHKPFDQLQSELEIAKAAVVIGGEYSHYKHLGQLYIVLDLVITEADDRLAVVYSRKNQAAVKFVRPLASWQEEVIVDGKRLPRFSLVSAE